MALNKKTQRIINLYNRGVTDHRILARKIGYDGSATQAGIERVRDALREAGLLTE